MKKTFKLVVPKIAVERQVDAIKFEIKKYLARERRKELLKTADFWDFDCRIGATEEVAEEIAVSEINANISKVAATGVETFYLEILARPGYKKKPVKNI